MASVPYRETIIRDFPSSSARNPPGCHWYSIRSTMVLQVAVIGGGIAGLYAALLLQREGHHVHVFEASERVGGRVYTYHFTDEKNQFFDAGAMVLPPTRAYNTVIQKLIDYVNTHPSLPANMLVTKLKEKMNYSGVRTLANGQINDWYSRGNLTPSMVGWPVPAGWENQSVNDRMTNATGDYVEGLFRDFDATFSSLLPLDVQFGSFRSWIRTKRGNDEGWPDAFIDFVETILFETNAFDLSCVEIIVRQMYLVPSPGWSLIEGGMGRLPDAMAEVLGWDNITLGAYVKGLEPRGDKVIVTAAGYNGEVKGTFAKVVVAVPPAALVMIADRPRWQPDKETALRAMNVEPVYRMGMRFKTRWWDRRWVYSKSDGSDTMGEAVADIPVRFVMFPPVVDEQNLKDRPGTIVISASGPDAQAWAPLAPTMRRSQAIHCLKKIINDSKIDILEELIDTFDVVWSNRSANGTTAFLPGQFERSLPAAKRAEGNIYFAGEHLSHHHGWIMGAAQSALDVVREVLANSDLASLSQNDNKAVEGAGSAAQDVKPSKFPYEFYPKDPLFLGGVGIPTNGWPARRSAKGVRNLGRGHEFPGRAETCYLAGPYFEM
ncbi:FAD/NAD(P)-binding domain-containing protein [Dentipellis sp. KUC8613]|nr:FAD/NAD(P)-binding domain-containing protein [Dentipellis sp. KUC8613]